MSMGPSSSQTEETFLRLLISPHLETVDLTFVVCLFCFFFPNPLILLICCVSNTKGFCVCHMSQGIRGVAYKVIGKQLPDLLYCLSAWGLQKLVLLNTSLILSSGTPLQPLQNTHRRPSSDFNNQEIMNI